MPVTKPTAPSIPAPSSPPAPPATRRLGRVPSPHDPRTLHLAGYLTAELPPAPPTCSWTERISSWDALGNNQYGDCVFAGALHLEQEWTAYASVEFRPTTEDALRAYADVTGFSPDDPATDRGANMLTALKYWRGTGFAGRQILAFVACEPGNTEHIKDSIALFGGAYVGVALPLSAQDQRVWSVPVGGANGQGAPGSWGGHCVPVIGYDSRGLVCVTWGALKRMTWQFFRTYVDESYAVLSNDWISAQGTSPSGLDLDALRADLAAVTG